MDQNTPHPNEVPEPEGPGKRHRDDAEQCEQLVQISEPGMPDGWCWISVADAFQPLLEMLRGKR